MKISNSVLARPRKNCSNLSQNSWKFIFKWGDEGEGVFSLSMLPVIVIMMMSSLFWWPRVLKMMMVWPAPAPSGSVCGVTVPPRGRSPVLQTQKRQKPFVPQGSFQNYKIQGGQQSPLFMAMGNSVRDSQWFKITQKVSFYNILVKIHQKIV